MSTASTAIELTDDVRTTDPLWGVVVVELTDAQQEAHDADFLDSNGMDLLLELRDAARDGTAREFVKRWAQKLADGEAEAAEKLSRESNW